MVAIIDTTDVVESSMFLKAKLKKNMVGDNYYLQSLQSKVDAEWNYRSNVFDVEEELEKQMSYTKEKPKYTPIEVVIQHVRTDVGEKLSDDWQKLVFRDIKHPTAIGGRYRFSFDFEKNPIYTEEEKEKECSIWIAVNRYAMNPTSSVMVRRCNSNLMFAGSPTMSLDNITEYHCEPCILDDDFKYINIYMNDVVNINQAEIYATMQYNYFTQNIKPNDRFIIGNVDLEDRNNNTVFKVKAISKFKGNKTFQVGNKEEDLGTVPLVLIAMDRDVISEKDDFEHRISSQPTLYRTEKKNETIVEPSEEVPIEPPIIPPVKEETEDIYEIIIQNEQEDIVLLGEEVVYKSELLHNKTPEDVVFNCVATLFGTEKDEKYFDFKQEGNKITILNKRACLTKKLSLLFSCVASNGQTYKRELLLSLGGN